ncbi:hypothetical protein GVAV_001666 [Gurleya vavrai]
MLFFYIFFTIFLNLNHYACSNPKEKTAVEERKKLIEKNLRLLTDVNINRKDIKIHQDKIMNIPFTNYKESVNILNKKELDNEQALELIKNNVSKIHESREVGKQYGTSAFSPSDRKGGGHGIKNKFFK